MLTFMLQYPLVLYDEKKLAEVPVLKAGSPVFCVSMGVIRWEHHDICYRNSRYMQRPQGRHETRLAFSWQPAFKGSSQGSVRTTLIPPEGGMPPVTSESFTRPHNAATWGHASYRWSLKGSHSNVSNPSKWADFRGRTDTSSAHYPWETLEISC